MGKYTLFSSLKKAFRTPHETSNKKRTSEDQQLAPKTLTPIAINYYNFASPSSNEDRSLAMAVAEATASAEVLAKAINSTGRFRFRSNENQAAIVIQTRYRGYLARRALRALKALVKLQALVRGFSVRKETQVIMRCMQSLLRAQERLKTRRLESLVHDEDGPNGAVRQRKLRRSTPTNEEHESTYVRRWVSIHGAITPTLDSSPPASTASKMKNRMGKLDGAMPNYMVPTQSTKAKVRERRSTSERPTASVWNFSTKVASANYGMGSDYSRVPCKSPRISNCGSRYQPSQASIRH